MAPTKLPAKPGQMLTLAQYHRLLNAAIARFQHATTNCSLRGEMALIYSLCLSMNSPFTRTDIANLMHATPNSWSNFHLHGRLQYLLRHDFLSHAGRHFATDWSLMHNRATTFYTINHAADPPRAQANRRILYARVDALNLAYRRSRYFLAHASTSNPRTSAILSMRANGATLNAIGNHFHLSRERIRQILGRAYFPTFTPTYSLKKRQPLTE